MAGMLSIFTPYRGRTDFCRDFMSHYRHYFPDAKIYILEQDDGALFKRGQLMNVIFNQLTKDSIPMGNMLFVDVDIRLKYWIDFEDLLVQHGTVVIPFNKLSLYTLEKGGQYRPTGEPSYFLDAPDGGVTLFTEKMFWECNGFSNLYIGWGREDSDFVRRNKVTRLANEMIHLEHKRNSEWKSAAFQKNDRNFQQGSNPLLDGRAQTTGVCHITRTGPGIYHCKIRDIGVIGSYTYKGML
jgi:hypothetical protein